MTKKNVSLILEKDLEKTQESDLDSLDSANLNNYDNSNNSDSDISNIDKGKQSKSIKYQKTEAVLLESQSFEDPSQEQSTAKKPKSLLFRINIVLSLVVVLIFGIYFGWQTYIKYSKPAPKIENVYISPKQLVIFSGSSFSSSSGLDSSKKSQSGQTSDQSSSSNQANLSNNSGAQNQPVQSGEQTQNQNSNGQNVYERIRQIGSGYREGSSEEEGGVKQVQVLPQENK